MQGGFCKMKFNEKLLSIQKKNELSQKQKKMTILIEEWYNERKDKPESF